MADIRLDQDSLELLQMNWFLKLAEAIGLRSGQWGSSPAATRLGDPQALHVDVMRDRAGASLRFVPSDSSLQAEVDEIAAAAAAKVASRDYGGVVWHSATLETSPLNLAAPFALSDLQRRLWDQRRLSGWRRLGRSALLDFTEDQADGTDDLFVPEAKVHVHLAIPGPCPGPFVSALAPGAMEVVAAICSFALGRPTTIPSHAFATTAEDVVSLEAKRVDVAIPDLDRRGVSLDIFERLGTIGGPEAVIKARSAILTYDAALRQERVQVASLLFVAAAESLSVPLTPWRKERVTKRFRTFFSELMPDVLDAIARHDHAEPAFGIRTGSRSTGAIRGDLLDSVYELRSEPLHHGLNVASTGLGMAGIDFDAGARRALLSDFSELAILRYILAPRASLVGHPMFDQTE